MLPEPVIGIITIYVNQLSVLYSLNLYSDVCQLFLSKTGGKRN